MSQRNDNATRPLITALPFPRILLASLLAAVLAACGGSAGGSSDACSSDTDCPTGQQCSSDGSCLAAGTGGTGGEAGSGSGGSGGEAGGGTGGSGGTEEWPVPTCDEMCGHIYDDCGLGFMDPTTGETMPKEDCVAFCGQEAPPDDLATCFAHMECSEDAMVECVALSHQG